MPIGVFLLRWEMFSLFRSNARGVFPCPGVRRPRPYNETRMEMRISTFFNFPSFQPTGSLNEETVGVPDASSNTLFRLLNNKTLVYGPLHRCMSLGCMPHRQNAN